MVTLDPEINNAQKQQLVADFNKNDIVKIIKDAISAGIIEIPSGEGVGFEDVTIDIYASDFDITDPSTPIINNQEKASIISALIDKVNNGMKLYSGVVDVPSYTWTDENEVEHTEKIWLQGACGYWNNDVSFDRRLILIGDTDYSLGFLKSNYLDIVTVFFGCSLSNAEDRQVALMTLLLTDPTKYIRFKIRIEK